MRVLVLGGTGMLGHKLTQALSGKFEVFATRRNPALTFPTRGPAHFLDGLDVSDAAALQACLARTRPDAVLNAVGIIKHVSGAFDRAETIDINALLPNRLAALCAARGARLIHFSTDCVFSGARDGARGPNGYRESDPADARDLYGLSKLLGEPEGPGCLTLRTSIIGPELRAGHGLLEWFLMQGEATVSGYEHALFTGLPTIVLAELVAAILSDHPALEGLWHVAAAPISKYALLGLFRQAWGRPTRIEPNSQFYCDRRLDGSRFADVTGWQAGPWDQLVQRMRAD